VEALNDKEIATGKKPFVGQAQYKEGREEELNEHFNTLKITNVNLYVKIANVNLYVKNQVDTTDEVRLQEAFNKFGTATPVKLMVDTAGVSRYTTQEGAAKTVVETNYCTAADTQVQSSNLVGAQPPQGLGAVEQQSASSSKDHEGDRGEEEERAHHSRVLDYANSNAHYGRSGHQAHQQGSRGAAEPMVQEMQENGYVTKLGDTELPWACKNKGEAESREGRGAEPGQGQDPTADKTRETVNATVVLAIDGQGKIAPLNTQEEQPTRRTEDIVVEELIIDDPPPPTPPRGAGHQWGETHDWLLTKGVWHKMMKATHGSTPTAADGHQEANQVHGSTFEHVGVRKGRVSLLGGGADYHQMSHAHLHELGQGSLTHTRTRVAGVNRAATMTSDCKATAVWPLHHPESDTTHTIRLEEALAGDSILTIKELVLAPEGARKQMFGERPSSMVKQMESTYAGKIASASQPRTKRGVESTKDELNNILRKREAFKAAAWKIGKAISRSP
jgi:hypothetical protein